MAMLESPRLILRPAEVEDARNLYLLTLIPQYQKTLGGHSCGLRHGTETAEVDLGFRLKKRFRGHHHDPTDSHPFILYDIYRKDFIHA